MRKLNLTSAQQLIPSGFYPAQNSAQTSKDRPPPKHPPSPSPMLALAAILTFQILFALSCLLFFLFLVTIYVSRRPGHLTTSDHLFNPQRWKLKATPPRLHPSSLREGDLESNPQPTYHNPFDSSLTTTPTSSSSLDSSATECSSADTQSSGSNYPETLLTTTPITWRDPWRWRFGTGEESRGRGNGGAEERRIGVESPGLSPLGLGKYFFEGGVGLRDM